MDDEREAMVMFAAVLEELQRIQATLATIAAGLLGKTTPHPPEPSPVIGSESHGPSACADEKKVSIEKNFPKKSETNARYVHAWQRSDGVWAKCGGPSLCAECDRDRLAGADCVSDSKAPELKMPEIGPYGTYRLDLNAEEDRRLYRSLYAIEPPDCDPAKTAPSFYPGSRAQQLSDIDTKTLKVRIWDNDYYFPGLKLDLE